MKLFFMLLPLMLLLAGLSTHLLVSHLLERRRARRATGDRMNRPGSPQADAPSKAQAR